MAEIIESSKIQGVKFVQLKAFGDERGKFMETFRKEWFPERTWDIFQTNCSQSTPGVLRGLHYHHHQIDYWFVPNGMIRVGLADLRPSSPTFQASETIEIGDQNPVGIFIPCEVAHGFYSLTDATLTYIVDNYYNGDDELGVAWNDPALNVEWQASDPVLSNRDLQNPSFAELAKMEMA